MLCFTLTTRAILQIARSDLMFIRYGLPPFPGHLHVALVSAKDLDIFGVADVSCEGEALMRLRNYQPISDPYIQLTSGRLTPILGPLHRLDKRGSLEVSSRLEALHARAQERNPGTDIDRV